MKTNINSAWPTIDPGEFRHQITLLSPVAGTDSAGANVTYAADPVPVTAWAKIETIRGDEMIKAGQDVSQVFLKVTSWYRPDFTVNARIQAPSGNVFVIQYIENVREMNVFMVLTCLGIGANN
jgi:SPP1 family predicted phage head-tail adaptor